jgi:hypothetical protein
MCIYNLKFQLIPHKNARLFYNDQPAGSTVYCQTRRQGRNALCRRNEEILAKLTPGNLVGSKTRIVSLLLITSKLRPTHTHTHTHVPQYKYTVYRGRDKSINSYLLTHSVAFLLYPPPPRRPSYPHWSPHRANPIGWIVTDEPEKIWTQSTVQMKVKEKEGIRTLQYTFLLPLHLHSCVTSISWLQIIFIFAFPTEMLI